MIYRVTHITTYSGSEAVSVCHNEARLRPRELDHQRCSQFELHIHPSPSSQSWRSDYFGNAVVLFSFNHGYESLEVRATSRVELSARGIDRQAHSPPWDEIRDHLAQHQTSDVLQALEYTYDSPRIRTWEGLLDYGRPSFPPGRPILEALAELTERIHAEFDYDPQATSVTSPVEDVLRLRRGVCQDFAHLEIAILRRLGLAARYVSGYLRTYPPPGKPRLVGADASHAWLSVYCGPLGWIDVDPTNRVFPDIEHITLAWGRDYSDVAPLRGVFVGGGSHTLAVSVDVEPLEVAAEAPS